MEISTLLQEALSPDQTRRNQAEQNIEIIASQNFGTFLISCAKELCDEGKSKGIRQIAATLIKNMISYTPKYKGLWEQLDRETKLQVKQHVLSTLASSDKDVRKAAGIAVAGICKVELPIGEWTDIIDVLCQTSQNENRNIQLASITTLGYISQEISPRDLTDDSIGKVLSCIYTLLNGSSDLEILEVTLSALLNFLPYTRRFFENKEQKSLLLSLIFKYIQNQEKKLRLIAIQCMLETARQFYDFIEDHIDHFTPSLNLIMENDDEGCAILVYEFWCSIGDIEIARLQTKSLNLPCKNLCNKVYKTLLPIIYKHLLIGTVNSEDSWNLCKAASCLLSILSQCCEFNLIQEVIAFIGNNIGQSASLNKEAAIMAFGSILETVHRDSMASLVMNSIDTLINFLNDQNSTVSLKDTTAWVIEKIAEIYGEEFMKNGDLFERLLNMILTLLTASRRKVVCYLANSLHHFSVAFKPMEGQNSNMMSNHMKNCLEILLKLAFTPKSYDSEDNVALASFYAIGSLIENSAPDTRVIVSSFFNSLLEAFRSTLNPEYFESTKMRYDYQAYIAASLEPCFVSGYLSISYEGAREILDIIINTFKERKGVYEEGLMAASALALCVGPDFDPLVKEFGSYLIFALNSVNDTSLCKTAIHSTSDLIRSIGNSFSQYLNQIVPIVLGILSNTEADKCLKPHSFNVISDLFITCKLSVFNYFDNIMELIGSALEAATFLTDDKEDFETIEYFELLREHILECLTCIFQTVRDMKKEEEFKRYVVPIVRFVNTINQREYNPTTELVKNSLGLIADFCETYKGDMKQLVNISLVEEMIRKLKESKSPRVLKILNWSQKVISAAVK